MFLHRKAIFLHLHLQTKLLLWLQEQSEKLAHSCREQIESENSSGSEMVPGSKSNSASIHQNSAINSGTVVYAQEFDTSVTLLNIVCITLYVLFCILTEFIFP